LTYSWINQNNYHVDIRKIMTSPKTVFTCLLVLLLACACSLPPAYDFLAKNAEKDGVIERPSGLQYRVIKEGTGTKPGFRDQVTVNYRGTLIDGTEFDSSYKRGKPASFQLNRVIKGWTEGLALMQEGAKWELFIPPELAYGERGAGQLIGPDETLIFEVELIKVN
jgi:FKBP-type peptidyl-prolyl cis-trans isomerase